MATSHPWYEEFEFDLPRSLLRDLIELLNGMPHTQLNEGTVNAHIPEEQGVYQLFLDEMPVYVGKTDAEAGLNQRLARHARKIQQRLGLDPNRVSFKAVRIFVFTAVDLETQLIKHYASVSNGALEWNNSGFGSNDPGIERDTTKLKDTHFDLRYPIDIDVPLVKTAAIGTFSIADILSMLKDEVPYVIRFQKGGGARSRKPHPDLQATLITIPPDGQTTRSLMRLIQQALGEEWRVTVQPGYIILYNKDAKKYPHERAL